MKNTRFTKHKSSDQRTRKYMNQHFILICKKKMYCVLEYLNGNPGPKRKNSDMEYKIHTRGQYKRVSSGLGTSQPSSMNSSPTRTLPDHHGVRTRVFQLNTYRDRFSSMHLQSAEHGIILLIILIKSKDWMFVIQINTRLAAYEKVTLIFLGRSQSSFIDQFASNANLARLSSD